MGETLELLAIDERIPAAVRDARSVVPKAVRGPRIERWSSSLRDEDLTRLLAVIEGHLIPQLLDRYTPARCAALVSSRSQ